jgi:hypothetical protein
MGKQEEGGKGKTWGGGGVGHVMLLAAAEYLLRPCFCMEFVHTVTEDSGWHFKRQESKRVVTH